MLTNSLENRNRLPKHLSSFGHFFLTTLRVNDRYLCNKTCHRQLGVLITLQLNDDFNGEYHWNETRQLGKDFGNYKGSPRLSQSFMNFGGP